MSKDDRERPWHKRQAPPPDSQNAGAQKKKDCPLYVTIRGSGW